MSAKDLKLSVYLDEVGPDPEKACPIIVNNNITSVVLRNFYGTNNICDCTSDVQKYIKSVLKLHNLAVIAVYSKLGNCPYSDLKNISEEEIQSCFSVAQYFGAKYLIVGIGSGISPQTRACDDWCARLSHASIRNNIKILVEIGYDSHIRETSMILDALSRHKRLKLLYDPSLLITKHKCNPYDKYWKYLFPIIGAVDIRDFQVGRGPRPLGMGDAKLKDTMSDLNNSQNDIQIFLEPNLDCKYSMTPDRDLALSVVIQQLNLIQNGFNMPHNLNETIQQIKQAGNKAVRIVPMPGQPFNGSYQIEVSTGPQNWSPILTGLTKQMAEDIVQQANNKVLLG